MVPLTRNPPFYHKVLELEGDENELEDCEHTLNNTSSTLVLLSLWGNRGRNITGRGTAGKSVLARQSTSLTYGPCGWAF